MLAFHHLLTRAHARDEAETEYRNRAPEYGAFYYLHGRILTTLSDAKDVELLRSAGPTDSAAQILPRDHIATSRAKWPKLRVTLLVLSTIFLVCLLAMHALEIARLVADKQGVGLLPFCFVPLLLVLISLYVPSPAWSAGGWHRPARPHGVSWMVGVGLWSLWMMATVIVTFSKVKNAIGEAAYNGVDSKYPYSDRLVSRIVYHGVCLLIVLSFRSTTSSSSACMLPSCSAMCIISSSSTAGASGSDSLEMRRPGEYRVVLRDGDAP